LLLLFDAATPVPALLAVGAVRDVPAGFNNLGLHAVLEEAAPTRHSGAAGGFFQTFRSTGAILSTVLILQDARGRLWTGGDDNGAETNARLTRTTPGFAKGLRTWKAAVTLVLCAHAGVRLRSCACAAPAP
jgi:hypothetical protein